MGALNSGKVITLSKQDISKALDAYVEEVTVELIDPDGFINYLKKTPRGDVFPLAYLTQKRATVLFSEFAEREANVPLGDKAGDSITTPKKTQSARNRTAVPGQKNLGAHSANHST